MTFARMLLTVGTLLIGWTVAADEPPDDPVERKLSAAKKEYAAELSKALKTAGEALEKAENAARKKGDRVAAAKLKAERKSVDDDKEFPPSGAANLRKRVITQQVKLENAYEQAIRDYVKAGDDKKAEEISKSLTECRRGFIGVLHPAPRKVYRILNRHSGLALTLKTPQSPKDSPLVQAAVTDDSHQLWTTAEFQHDGSTVYAIRNLGCSMALTVDDYSRNQGAPIVVFPEAVEMRWKASPRRGGLTLQWILSGLLISVADESKEPGHRIIQWPDQTDGLNQVWLFLEVDSKGR